jgi:hypothetical protein
MVLLKNYESSLDINLIFFSAAWKVIKSWMPAKSVNMVDFSNFVV